MNISDVIELASINDDKSHLKGQQLTNFLLTKLLERNSSNIEIIRKYIRQYSRRQRKIQTRSLALRDTNTSDQHNSASESLKISTFSITSVESEPTYQEETQLNPEVVPKINEKQEEQSEQISINIKTKTSFLQPINQIEPAYPQNLNNPSKTEDQCDQRSKSVRQSVKSQLRKALIQKIKDLQQKNREQQKKGSMFSFLRGQSIYGQQMSIKRLQLRSDKNQKKVKTQGNQLHEEGLLCQMPRISQVLSKNPQKAEQLKSSQDMFPDVSRGYMQRNKRCLHIFLKMSREKNKSFKANIDMLQKDKQPQFVRKMCNSNVFKVGTLQLKKNI